MDLSFIIIIGLMVVFLIWSSHSQKKQRNAYQNYLNSIVVGSSVETIGGLRGVVAEISDDELTINVGSRKPVLIRVGRVAIKFPDQQQQKVAASEQKSVDASDKKDKSEEKKEDSDEKSAD